RRLDLAIHPARLMLGPPGPAHHAPPSAADSHVHRVGYGRTALRSPPSRPLLRIDPGGEDPLARRVEDAFDHQCAVIAHGVSSFGCVPRGGGGGRSGPPPKTGGWAASHSVASFSAPGASRHGRRCACRPREISPARSSTLRWRETAGRLIENGSAN